MKPVVEHCCGIDVHKETLFACVLSGSKRKEVKVFGSDRAALLAMKAWLRRANVTVVAMESTAAYWVPVYEVLEEAEPNQPAFDLRLCNAEQVKKVPGRKTDVGDAEWLARLTMYGLLRKSFVPPRAQRDLRQMVRTRRSYIEMRTNVHNQVCELLETAQIKLGNVVSDVFGTTGTGILRALISGVTDPKILAEEARGSLRGKRKELAIVLDGSVRDAHHALLNVHMQVLDQIGKTIEQLDNEAARLLQAQKVEWELLQTIPGIAEDAAAGILAEIGTDTQVFGVAARLASWAGICPGNNVSAGKKLRGAGGHIAKGNQYLVTLLVQAAWCAVRKKNSRFSRKYYVLKARLGNSKKAIIAIAHMLLRVIFAILKARKPYQEQEEKVVRQQVDREAQRKLRWLQRHGYEVTAGRPSGANVYTLAPAAPAPEPA